MSETPAAPGTPGAPDDGPAHDASGTTRIAHDLRALRRSRDDRVLAGVLGGLGRSLGVDPVLLRVVTVVLALFGGAGVLLYALAWLLIPEEGEEASTLDQALGRGTPRTGDRAPAVLLAALLAIVALGSLAGVLNGSWDGAALVILAGAGVVLLLRRRDAQAPTDGPDLSAQPGAPGPYESPVDDPGAAWAAAATSPAPSAAGTGWTGEPAGWEQPTWQQPAWEQPGWEEPAWQEPAPPAPPASPASRPRSALGPLTVSVALLAVGALAFVELGLGVDVPVAGYVAAALGVVGLGLLVGTWFGRSRGLVWLGLLLALAMVPAVAADRFGSWQETDVTVRPTTTADLDGTHDYGGGRVVWDLTGLELPEADRPTLTVDQGAGQLVVIVPPEADVAVDATVGVGELRTFDRTTGGFGNERTTVDLGPDGEGGGSIELELQLGIGQLEVRRAAA